MSETTGEPMPSDVLYEVLADCYDRGSAGLAEMVRRDIAHGTWFVRLAQRAYVAGAVAHAAEVDALRKELEEARAALTELAPASLGAELERTRADLAAARAEQATATEALRDARKVIGDELIAEAKRYAPGNPRLADHMRSAAFFVMGGDPLSVPPAARAELAEATTGGEWEWGVDYGAEEFGQPIITVVADEQEARSDAANPHAAAFAMRRYVGPWEPAPAAGDTAGQDGVPDTPALAPDEAKPQVNARRTDTAGQDGAA